MNTLKKTTLTLIGLWAIATVSATFADDSASVSVGATANPPMMQGYARMQGPGMFFNQYLRTDLSDTEKTSLATLEQSHMDAIKALFQNTQSGGTVTTTTDFQAQMKTLQDQFVTSLLPYIATDKQDAFQQAMAAMPQMRPGMMMPRRGYDDHSDSRANFEANITRTVTNITNGVQITETTTDSGTLARLQEIYNQWQNQKDLSGSTTSVVRTMLTNGLQTVITSTDAATVTDIQTKAANSPSGYGVGLGYFKKGQEDYRNDNTRWSNNMNHGNDSVHPIVQKSSLLPANISPLIDTKFAAFATSDAKIAWITSINQKIDILAAKVTSQRSKDILSALKDLLNEKLDAINNVGVDSSIINNIIQ